MAKKLIKWAKETGVSTLAIPAKVGQCRPCRYLLLLFMLVFRNINFNILRISLPLYFVICPFHSGRELLG